MASIRSGISPGRAKRAASPRRRRRRGAGDNRRARGARRRRSRALFTSTKASVRPRRATRSISPTGVRTRAAEDAPALRRSHQAAMRFAAAAPLARRAGGSSPLERERPCVERACGRGRAPRDLAGGRARSEVGPAPRAARRRPRPRRRPASPGGPTTMTISPLGGLSRIVGGELGERAVTVFLESLGHLARHRRRRARPAPRPAPRAIRARRGADFVEDQGRRHRRELGEGVGAARRPWAAGSREEEAVGRQAGERQRGDGGAGAGQRCTAMPAARASRTSL